MPHSVEGNDDGRGSQPDFQDRRAVPPTPPLKYVVRWAPVLFTALIAYGDFMQKDGTRSDAAARVEQRVASLEQRLNPLSESVARTQGAIDALMTRLADVTDQMRALTVRLDRVPDRPAPIRQ